MIGIIIVGLGVGNIEISTMNSLGSYMSREVVNMITILVLIGAMAKSAQISLHM